MRIDILSEVDGVQFAECYAQAEWDGVQVSFNSLADLRRNEASTGRFQDLEDLRNLAGGDVTH